MKVISKGELIAKFGEHNGTILWDRYTHFEHTQTVLRQKPEGFDKPKKVYKEHSFIVPPSDLAIVKSVVMQDKLEPRMVKWLVEFTIRHYNSTDTAGMSSDIAEARRQIILQLRDESITLKGMKAALVEFWS